MVAICLVVAGASVGPLAVTLRAAAYQSLGHIVELKVMAAEEFLSRAAMLAQQVTSRTVIRDKLADFHDNRMSREALADFTRDKLQDSLGLASELQGIARLDASGQLVVAVGQPFDWHGAVLPAIGQDRPTLSAPKMIDGSLRLMAAAPIHSRTGERIGTDLLLLNAQRLLSILREGESLSSGSTMALIDGRDPRHLLIPFGETPVSQGMSLPATDRLTRLASSLAGSASPPIVDSSADPILAAAEVPGAGWVMALRADADQATRSVDGLVWTVAISALTLAGLGVLGLLLVLRPLTGSMIVHANDLRRQIDDLERTRTELQDRSQQLAQSNTDLEQFAYVASHDLQTPLRNIVSYTQLLERRYKGQLDQDADEFIGFIVDNSKQMSRLIADLLEYSRTTNQSKPLYPVQAGQALALALKNLMTDISNSGATVTTGELPAVIAERARLVSLFQNLIGNAIKYRSPERPLEVKITAESTAPGIWRFQVADNGIGIEPQYHDKIFEIFQRLSPQTHSDGTGIGLTICRRIIHRFNGRIWVESVPGQGTTFLFTLKAAPAPN